MTVKVADIVKIMESLAPVGLAEKWDNPGLQVGSLEWPVKKVWIALDATPQVVDAACENDADLLITHHPLLFKPLKTVDFSTSAGSAILKAARNNLSIFSAHTNLDSASGGLNDELALKIGLTKVRVLGKSVEPEKCKVVFYVPSEYKHKVMNALFETEAAGVIDKYTCCSFSCSGKATYKPGEDARPYEGSPGELTTVDEVRVESVVLKKDVDMVVDRLKTVHPYEVMDHNVYPLLESGLQQGLGRVGGLGKKTTLSELALQLKNDLGLSAVKIAGNGDMEVSRVALCTGSGSGLMESFFKSGADVYISGDLHYHDARAVEDAGLGMIDLGHFASEFLMVEALEKKLREKTAEAGFEMEIVSCNLESDPFRVV